MRVIRTPLLALLALLAACGSGAHADPYDPASDASDYTHPLGQVNFPEENNDSEVYDDRVKLDDGREIAIYFHDKVGLIEQHRGADHDGWSKPHVLFATKADTCQYPTLKAKGETVATEFGFGIYCYDGEPPEQSLAGVATGDLTHWDMHLQERSDGYEKVRISDDGATVTFTSDYAPEKVVWRRGKGIDDPMESP